MNLINVSIITGFLGVGKTTLIKDLIQCKPPSENWAVIVNEFGVIGVDALLLEDPAVVIKQVPGGCACCTAQLPFQLALNQLLKSKTLHRIFIEPSGLGHADTLSSVLNQSQYDKWLRLNSVITLVDPEQFSNPRYRNHDIYRRQLDAANAFLISKQDLTSEPETKNVYDYMALQGRPYLSANSAASDLLEWMDSIVMESSTAKNEKIITEQGSSVSFEKFRSIPEKQANPLESGFSRFSFELTKKDVCDLAKLSLLIESYQFSRLKGLVNTSQGTVSINSVMSQASIEPYKYDTNKFVIEIIHHEEINQLDVESALRLCINET